MKSTYVGTRSANVGDIRCLFALATENTSRNILVPPEQQSWAIKQYL